MQSTLASLEKGHHFEPAQFNLSPEWVRDYAEAVEDSAMGTTGNFVPPMALTALAIRALLEQSALPPGSIHVAQEISFRRPVRIGESLTVRATIASRGERQGWVLMGVSLAVEDAATSPVMDGRATITFPLDPEASS